MKATWRKACPIMLGLLCFAGPANAACPSPLVNGTSANANDVMAWLDCKAPLDNPSFSGSVIVNTALGISTGSPSGRLEIADSSQNAMAYISAFTTGAGQRAQLNLRKSATNTIGGLAPNASGDTLGVISVWGVTSSGAWNDDAGGISVSQYGNAGTTRVGGTMNFFTGDGTAGASVRMVILGTGNVGIATTSPSYTLHVNGSVAGTSAYNNLSDGRLKRDIEPVSNALAMVEKMQGVRFRWRAPSDRVIGRQFDLPVETQQIGFIAQDIRKIVPEVVSVANDQDGTMSVAESKIVPLLVEALKELHATNRRLEARVAKLEVANRRMAAN